MDLRILGVDISPKALNLANENLRHVRQMTQYIDKGTVSFAKADILARTPSTPTSKFPTFETALREYQNSASWDILISNPPYISPSAYWSTTTRSVRAFEPKLALVPSAIGHESDIQQGDRFYPRLLEIAQEIGAKIVLLEVSGTEQALRVVDMVRRLGVFCGVEVWRDEPGTKVQCEDIEGVPAFGEGNVRSVLCWRVEGTSWLGKNVEER